MTPNMTQLDCTLGEMLPIKILFCAFMLYLKHLAGSRCDLLNSAGFWRYCCSHAWLAVLFMDCCWNDAGRWNTTSWEDSEQDKQSRGSHSGTAGLLSFGLKFNEARRVYNPFTCLSLTVKSLLPSSLRTWTSHFGCLIYFISIHTLVLLNSANGCSHSREVVLFLYCSNLFPCVCILIFFCAKIRITVFSIYYFCPISVNFIVAENLNPANTKSWLTQEVNLWNCVRKQSSFTCKSKNKTLRRLEKKKKYGLAEQ